MKQGTKISIVAMLAVLSVAFAAASPFNVFFNPKYSDQGGVTIIQRDGLDVTDTLYTKEEAAKIGIQVDEIVISDVTNNNGQYVCLGGQCRNQWNPIFYDDSNARTGNPYVCDDNLRGQTVYVLGGKGVPDYEEQCRKTSDESYRWITIP